jgi:hypothetical protein
MATLSPISVMVTRPGLLGTSPPAAVRGVGVVRAASATQSGQWKPTAAGRMHSGQIGRPQRWQLM